MKHVVKSLILAFAGTGVLFFFLMMAAVPVLALLSRLSGDVTQKSVVVNPGIFLRSYGLPFAVGVFVLFFFLSEYRLRKLERAARVMPRSS